MSACRNTVFGAEAQEAGRHLDGWLTAGIEHFRLEFVHESAVQVAAVVEAFRATLAGTQDAALNHPIAADRPTRYNGRQPVCAQRLSGITAVVGGQTANLRIVQ
ncbi:MAG: hypothetical protein R2932_18975 [Caldilineaceae bacterium]